jgi:phospho-N-acetylmuramoyl-pentapeptide-transferase
MKEMILEFMISTTAVFVLTVLFTRWLIPYLKSKKMGQKILEIGPRWHKSKDGTPTMGGVAFILATLIVMALVAVYTFVFSDASELRPLALTLGLATINGLIGIIDDRCKLLKKENQGLLAYQKFLLQVAAAIVYLFALNRTGYIDTSLHIPFTSFELELGWFYYIFATILIVGVVNSVNLTDGIDGLASGVTFIVGAFFALVAFSQMNASLSFASAALIGSTLGFLVYNFNPARIFMGDTGSLFLGGMVVGCAFVINDPLVIVIAGLIYIIEAASVMIQVGVFKLTHGYRVFKMAPIHHHFEKCGWSERKVFWIFSAITLVCCAIAWFAI